MVDSLIQNTAGVLQIMKPATEFRVNTVTLGTQSLPSVTSLKDGGWLVTWVSDGQDGSGSGIYAQRYAASGLAINGEFRVNSTALGNQTSPIVAALPDGGWLATWTSVDQDGSGGGIYAQRYDVNGNSVGSETLINTTTALSQEFSAISVLQDGGWVVTWNSTSQDGSGLGIFGQRFSANGTAVGSEFQVNTYTTSDQWWPASAALSDGGWVVTWHSEGQDGSDRGVFAQRYDSNGAAVGTEFLVNTFTPSFQESPKITALADGGWLITWQSYGQDASWSSIHGQRYAANGSPLGSEFQANTYTDHQQIDSSVTALADGGWVVTWASQGQDNPVGSMYERGGIYSQRYASEGTRVGAEFLVNTKTADSQYYGRVAALADGGWVVTWMSDNQDGSGFGIYGQRYDANGLAQEPASLSSDFTEDRTLYADASQITDPDGVGTINWQWQRSEDNGLTWTNIAAAIAANYTLGNADVGNLIRVAGTYTDGLGTVETVFSQPSTSVININDAPLITSNGGGETASVAIFENTTAVTTVTAKDPDANTTLSYSISGGADAALFNINAATGALSFKAAPDFEAPADAGVNNVYDVVVQVSDGTLTDTQAIAVTVANILDGSDKFEVVKVGSEILANTYTTNIQLNAAVTRLSNGGFVITWQDDSGSGAARTGFSIKAQLFGSNGAKVGTEFLVNTQATGETVVPTVTGLAGGENFVIAWVDTSGSLLQVKAQIFDGNGTKVGTEFSVNTQTADIRQAPKVTGLIDGSFVVTWMDTRGTLGDSLGSGIKAQLFTAGGTPVGTEFLVNSQTFSDQSFPSLTALTNGGFVVSWTDNSGTLGDGSGTGIKAQVFRANGTTVGSEFLVNTQTLSFQERPTIAALANGDFVVSWTDNSGTLGDNSFTSIKAKMFNADGTEAGTEFLVNTQTSNVQDSPTITSLVNGGFVVSWADNNGGGNGSGIKAQVFGADGSKVGTEFSVNTQTLGGQQRPTITGLESGGFVVSWTDYGVNGDANIKAQLFSVNQYDPVLTSDGGGDTATVSIIENTMAVTTVIANDLDASTTLRYSISGGVDAALFQIDPTTGQLSFRIAPDFEAPADVATNNVYDVIVQVSDGTWSDTQAIAVTITNTNEAPTGAVAILSQVGGITARALNASDITDLSAQFYWDPANGGNGHIYQLIGTRESLDNAEDYAVGSSIAGVYGYLASVESTQERDFLFSLANSLSAPNGYWVGSISVDGLAVSNYGIRAGVGWYSEGSQPSNRLGRIVEFSGNVTLSNVPSVTAVASDFTEDRTLYSEASLITDPDGVGTINWQWQRSVDGGANWSEIANAIAASYTLGDADVGSLVRVAASYIDGGGTAEVVYSSASSTVINVNDAPVITSNGGGDTTSLSIAENGTAVTKVTATDPDANTTLSYSISGGADAGIFDINPATGALSFKVAPNFEAPADMGVDNVYDVEVQVSDGALTDAQAIAVTVTNVNEQPSGSLTLLSQIASTSTRALNASDITDPGTQYYWDPASGGNGHIYQLFKQPTTWFDAKVGAETASISGVGGYLVTITSKAENDIVWSVAQSYATWNGASDAEAEGVWKWVTGPEAGTQFWLGGSSGSVVNANYVNWFSFEPDNFSIIGTPTGADYGLIADYGSGANGAISVGYWGDSFASDPQSYIAEFSDAVTVNTPAVTAAGSDFTQGKTLYADASLITDPDGVGALTWQWQRSLDNGLNWINIAAANAAGYTLSDADVGSLVRVAGAYTDGLGTVETVYSQPSSAVINVNDAPVLATPIPNLEILENVLWSYQIPADAFSDVDGDALVYSATLADGSALPAWLTFDAVTRTFSGTPPTNSFGGISLRLFASDTALTASSTFTLTVTDVLGQLIDGTAGDDVLNGTAGADTINGFDGNDTIYGNVGNDVIEGGAGNDYLEGGFGNDVITGGAGNDRVYDFTGGSDSLYGGAGDDEITVYRQISTSSSDNIRMEAGEGNDTLYIRTYSYSGAATTIADGGGGNDAIYLYATKNGSTITTGLGSDVVDIDQLDLSFSNSNYIFLTDFTAGIGGDRIKWDVFCTRWFLNWDGSNPFGSGYARLVQSGADTLLQIDRDGGGDAYLTLLTFQNTLANQFVSENLGGYEPDGSTEAGLLIDGTAGDDILNGTAGADTINGFDGNDTIYGNVGNDVIEGGAGNDYLEGGFGNDVITGGAGNDRVYDFTGGSDSLYGGAGDDEITVSRQPSTSSSDNIRMEAGEGNDTLYIGTYSSTGNRTTIVDSGIGNDFIHLYATANGSMITTGLGSDVVDIDDLNLSFSNSNYIFLTDFSAGIGGDRIKWDLFCSSWLIGWDGSDPFGSGYARLVQSGADTLLQIDRDGGGNAYLTLLTFQNTVATQFVAENFGGFDPRVITYLGTQNADQIVGSDRDDILDGLAGDDRLTAGAGNDIVYGGDGNDFIIGQAGADFIDGGAGNDTLVGDNDAQGGGDDADEIYGGAGTDYLNGEGGDDLLFGGSDTDFLEGLAGNDLMDGGDGGDYVLYRLATSGVTVDLIKGTATGGAGSDTLISVENVEGSPFDDIVTLSNSDGYVFGAGGNDVLTGGAGNDYLEGGSGDDTMEGGAGSDFVEYRFATSSVSVDLHQGRATGGDGNDTLNGIESVGGSEFDDTLVLSATSGNAFGKAGNDALTGGAGNDRLYGGEGIDTAFYNGALGDYNITNNLDGSVTVTDNRTGNPNGSDMLVSLELLNIGGTLYASDGKPLITSNGGVDTATVSITENSTAVTRVVATSLNANASLTYSIAGGADAALFQIDPITGELSFRTAPDFEAASDVDTDNVYDVEVQVSDGGNLDIQAIAVTVTNIDDAPVVATPIPDQNVGEDMALSFQVPTATFNDSNGDTLTYNASLPDGSPLPDWLSFDAATQTFSGTPPLNFNGNVGLTVTASDASSSTSDTFTLNVTPVNDAPTGSLELLKQTGTVSVPAQEFKVSASTSLPSVTALPDGGWFSVWAEQAQDGSGNIVGQRFASSGALLGNKVQLPIDGNSAGDTVVTLLSDGSLVAMWSRYNFENFTYDFVGQRFSVDGVAHGSTFTVLNDSVNFVGEPAITPLVDGGWLATFTAEGVNRNDVFGQRFSAEGTAQGSEFLVNTFTDGGQERSSVVGLSDGGWLVIWMSDFQDGSDVGIIGQRFSADGQRLGFDFRVNTVTAGSQTNPSVAALRDGGWVVAWLSQPDPLGLGDNISAQRYSANGAMLGPEFQVKAGPSGQTSVAALTDGGWVIIWSALSNDGSADVYGQRYSSDGVAQGTEFAVNDVLAGNQYRPVVVALADGGWVISWNSSPFDVVGENGTFTRIGDTGIFSQRFDAAGNKAYTDFTYADAVGADFTEGQVVFAGSSLISDPDGLGNVTWQWQRSLDNGFTWEDIPSAGQNSYTLSAPDIGNLVRAKAVYTDGDGTIETVYSASSPSVAYLNDAPTVAALIADQSATEDAVFSFVVPAGSFADVDPGDVLTLSATLANGSQLPSWLLFNAATGTFSGTPLRGDVGAVSVRVTATDAGGLTVSDDFNLTVAPETIAPTATITDNVPGTAIGTVLYTVTFSETVTGLAVNDFAVTNGTVSSVTGSGTSYVVAVAPSADFEGTLALSLNAGAVLDKAGNQNAGVAAAGQVVDTRKPVVTTITPTADSIGVAVATNITLAYSEAIRAGTGVIELRTAAGALVESFNVATSNRLTFAGSSLTVDPTALLSGATQYRLSVADGAVLDVAGNAAVALTTYTFTTLSAVNIINGTAVANTLNGTAGDDAIYGFGGNDTLNGNAGNDLLDGGTGNDRMTGGAGDDIYVVDSATDTVTEAANGGNDTVRTNRASYTLANNVENLTYIGDATFSGTGNAANNSITGGIGNDTLDGRAGNDIMTGGLGNDRYVVDSSGDVVVEQSSEGNDMVTAGMSYVLGANVENLTLSGNAAINGTGNAVANQITGNSGANILRGAGGADTLNGAGGTDTAAFDQAASSYALDHTGSAVIVSDLVNGEGTDTLTAIENLSFAGANYAILSGTAAVNTINGGAGSQAIFALGGNDIINGGAGNDIIVAGLGNDAITLASDTGGRDFIDGGAGEDTFTLATATGAEAFVIYTRAAALQALSGLTLNLNTEIVVTRNGQVIAELDNIEEIVVSSLRVTSPAGANGGTVAGDTIQVVGDFNQTSLNFNTITIDGTQANDVVDISALESAHRIVFTSNGGQDTVVGALRPQDIVNMGTGPTAAVDHAALAAAPAPVAPTPLAALPTDDVVRGTVQRTVDDNPHADDSLHADDKGGLRPQGVKRSDDVSGVDDHSPSHSKSDDDASKARSSDDHGARHGQKTNDDHSIDPLPGNTASDLYYGKDGADMFKFRGGDTIFDFDDSDDIIDLRGLGVSRDNFKQMVSVSQDSAGLSLKIGDAIMRVLGEDDLSLSDFMFDAAGASVEEPKRTSDLPTDSRRWDDNPKHHGIEDNLKVEDFMVPRWMVDADLVI